MVLPDEGRGRRHLAAYAKRFSFPVRTLARVDRLHAMDGKYVLQLGADSIVADNVVVATGTFGRTPSIPDFSLDLDPSIRQLHSSEYRRPAQLKPGSVLVVAVHPLAPTSRSSLHPPIRPCWPVATLVRCRYGSTIGVRGWSCRPLGFLPSTCSPGARPSALKR